MSHDTTTPQPRQTVFDVDVEKLARVYAIAALDAAGDAPQALVEDLVAIRDDVLGQNPRLADVFDSALISPDEKVALLDRLFGGRVGDLTLSVLKVLAEKHRLGILRSIATCVEQLSEERLGHVPVEVSFAQPADAGLVAELTEKLRAILGKEPEVHVRTDEGLIAGFVVRVGDKVFDASAKTSLELARDAMLAASLQAIQADPTQFYEGNATDQ